MNNLLNKVLGIAGNKIRRYKLRIYFGIEAQNSHVGKRIKVSRVKNSLISIKSNVSLYDDVALQCSGNKIGGKTQISIGENTLIKSNVLLSVKGGTLSIGDNCAIGKSSEIICENTEVRIGNDVRLAAECFIITNNHNFGSRDAPIREQGRSHAPVIIEDDVWIGRRVMIMPA